jgi:hypothetical protein
MDRSYPYTRRIARRAQGRRPFAALVLLGLAGCGVALALAFGPDRIAAAANQATPQAASPALASPQVKPSPRRVYPYSVVPGGVASQAELVRIVRSDKVVASHYASFDVSRAHEVSVAKPRAVHVSYRKGDMVYWTAKKVMLREGETLLSDGKNEMRTRCANRISDVAQFPVEAHAPSAELLDTAYEGEDGSLQNASAAMVEEGDLASFGQQPQLPASTNASASELASTTIGRTGSAAPGAMPTFADRLGTGPLTPLAYTPTPGAIQQAQDTASDGAVSSAPALIVATDVTQSEDAAPDSSAPSPAPSAPSPLEPAGAAPLAPSEPAAAQPEFAATPKPWSAAPTTPATSADEKPRPIELPEPGTAWLIALALGSLLVMRKKR